MPGKVILFDLNDGADEFHPVAYPFRPTPGGHVAHTLTEVKRALDALATQPHDFTTLAIDTAGELESLIWKYICWRDEKDDITKFGYSKGYTVALAEWQVMCHKLDRLRDQRGMQILVLAHSEVIKHSDPTIAEDYHRIVPKIHDKARYYLEGWCDVVAYLAHEEGATKSDGNKARGYNTGQRIMHFERAGGFNAKTRLPLPKSLEIPERRPWAPITEALRLARDPETLRLDICVELDRIGDKKLSVKVLDAVAEAGDDASALLRYRRDLSKREPTPTEETANADT